MISRKQGLAALSKTKISLLDVGYTGYTIFGGYRLPKLTRSPMLRLKFKGFSLYMVSMFEPLSK